MSTSLWLKRRYFDREAFEASFARGIVRDVPRHAIPPGGSYDLEDYLLDRPGMMYKRGGTAYQSVALSGQDDLIGIATPEYPGDPRVIAFASDSVNTTAFDITTDTPGSGLDANNALIAENPPLYVDRLIVCDGLGVAAPQKLYLNAGTVAIADLGGSPPTARYSCLHAGRLVLANTVDHPNYVYFSDPIDAENTWDTDPDTGSWIQVDEPVTGLASVQGVLIVFSRGGYQRILGDVPPGYDTTKAEITMSLQPGAKVGCIDARSIAPIDNEIVVANENGVFAITGAGVRSLTTKPDASGINQLWTETIRGFAPALGAVVASGFLNDHLFVTVTRRPDPDTEFAGQRDTFMYFTPEGSWTRLSEACGGVMYATRFAPTQEMYFALNDETDNRARRMSTIFTPTAALKNDADGTEIEPSWTSRTLGLEAGVALKHYGDAHLTYRLTDAATDAPTLAVETASGLEADGATLTVAESPLAATSTLTRRRLTFAREGQGVTLTLTQEGPSAATEIHLLELLVRNLDPGDGQ